MFSKLFFQTLIVYEIRWKNIVQPDRTQVIMWRMRIAWWISKAKNTQSEYEIRIDFA